MQRGPHGPSPYEQMGSGYYARPDGLALRSSSYRQYPGATPGQDSVLGARSYRSFATNQRGDAGGEEGEDNGGNEAATLGLVPSNSKRARGNNDGSDSDDDDNDSDLFDEEEDDDANKAPPVPPQAEAPVQKAPSATAEEAKEPA